MKMEGCSAALCPKREKRVGRKRKAKKGEESWEEEKKARKGKEEGWQDENQ